MPKAKTAQSRAETTEQLAPSGAGNKENSLLQFDVRIQSIRPGESIKGTASVNINGAFAIRGVKIIEGSNGLFVSMPSYKVGNEYKDICFPITQECRKQLHEAVIGAYEQAISQGQDTVGYAVETFTNTGFGGEIKLMVGFLKDGTINRVETLSHNETPGLGNKIERSKSDFAVQFEGKNPADFKLAVRKDGGDVDAITASTISSRAFSDAVSRAYEVYKSIQNSGNHE